MTALTTEQFRAALPATMKKAVNPLLIMKINNVLDNPEEWDMYKENLLSYTHVLQQGKFKLEQYLNAVKYVGYKVMGLSNQEAYLKTFPEKALKFNLAGTSDKDISSYVAAFNRSKLVMLIYEQTLIPTHIINAPAFQAAINRQVWLMKNAKSEMVQTTAANSLLNHLKAPEVQKMELDIGMKENKVLTELKEITTQLAMKQKLAIEAGQCSAKEIAQQDIITIEGD